MVKVKVLKHDMPVRNDPLVKPGIYLARVEDCLMDDSADVPYARLSFCDANTGRFLCEDVLRFPPRPSQDLLAKLVQLGIECGAPSIEPEDLIGRRVFIAVYHERVEDCVIGAAVNDRELDYGYLSEEAGRAAPEILSAVAVAQ